MKKRAKKSNMRTRVLIVAAALIGTASIAYAAYSQNLTVNGNGTATGGWNVVITDITKTSSTGVTENSPPSYDGTSATFDDNLEYPGATAAYDVTVTNNGTIPAKLTSLTDLSSTNSADPTYITYLTTGLTSGTTTLAANGATNVLHVTVTWDGASSPDTTSGNSKAATITLSYSQNT